MGIPVLRWLDPPAGPAVALLDQTRLPAEESVLTCRDVPELVDAIRRLAVRGAPLLGVAGGFGVALAAYLRQDVTAAAGDLAAARPTAVNLAWGVQRVLSAYHAALAGPAAAGPAGNSTAGNGPAGNSTAGDGPGGSPAGGRAGADRAAAAALAEARAIAAEDAAASAAMAANGLTLVPEQARILTHCNTGALVSAGAGTAFAVALAAHRAGRLARLWVDETRPLLQGVRLTAYEAGRARMPYTVLPDGAAASLMAAGKVDLVLVGADRIAADGSVANKVGTYGLAVLARHHGVPFVVVAPVSTVDFATSSGAGIVVEHRPGAEVTAFAGIPVAPAGSEAYNPAFDVTPPGLVTAIVTERGIVCPVTQGKLRLLEADTDASAGARGAISMER